MNNSMKFVEGIALPFGDHHFSDHLAKGPKIDGAGTYQLKKIEMALNIAPDRRGLALDVGGHVGLWSRILCRHFNSVHAFEPVPALAECFQINAPAAALHTFALGEAPGQVEISVIAENSGNCHVVPFGTLSAAAVTVRICRLDDVVRERALNSLDLLKIDVEGFEVPVLLGARVTIERDRPVIVVEQKPGNAERYGRGQLDAVELLKSWGYEVASAQSGDYFMKWKG